MLHYKTVAKPTLELLNKLMNDNMLRDFVLVGGTALALRLGHRISVDVDLFTKFPFNAAQLSEYLQSEYIFSPDFIAENTLKGEIDDVVIDCIAHQYKWIEEPAPHNGIRLAGLKDIAAMKLNAIIGNGTRLKDFIDLAYLSTELSLNKMLWAYHEKYGSNSLIALKALLYFDDINFDEPILMANEKTIRWKRIEARLIEMVNSPDKIFGDL
jgi:hypothetical protein